MYILYIYICIIIINNEKFILTFDNCILIESLMKIVKFYRLLSFSNIQSFLEKFLK